MVETLAALRKPDGFRRHLRVARAASYQLATWVVDRLRAKRLISVVVKPADVDLPSSGPTPEQCLLAAERERRLGNMEWKASGHLSRIQSRWMDGMKDEVELRGKLRLARVAERMGRGKVAATQARANIREVFDRLGYRDLLEED
jgi:hypothetical protein